VEHYVSIQQKKQYTYVCTNQNQPQTTQQSTNNQNLKTYKSATKQFYK